MTEEELLARIAKSQETIAEGVVRTYNVSWIADAIKILIMASILITLIDIANTLGG